MASPFAKYQPGAEGPAPDIYNQYVKSQEPISNAILMAGEAVAKGITQRYKNQADKEKAAAEAQKDARKEQLEMQKMEEERRRAAIAGERERQKIELDRARLYMEGKEKETNLRIKGAEGRYERMKSRLDDINAEIGGYQLDEEAAANPEVKSRIEQLRKLKDQLINDMTGASKDIEGAYGDLDNLNLYRERTSQSQAEENRKLALATETGGKIFDPLSAARRPDGSIDMSRVNTVQGNASGIPVGGYGTQGGAGVEPPKFPLSGTTRGDARSTEPSAAVPRGRLPDYATKQEAGTGLTGLPVESQPIGSNPVVTDIGSSWKNSNTIQDPAPVASAAGGRIIYSDVGNGTMGFRLAVNPDASPADKERLDRMASIVAFSNTMSNEQAASLSGLIRGEKGQQATELYRGMLERGMIPRELDIVKFKAATALSLYRSGGSSALGNLSPELATQVGDIMAKNADVQVVPSDPIAREVTRAPAKIEYTPASATWSPPFDVDRTARLMRSGAIPNGPKMKALFDQAHRLDQAGFAKSRLLAQQQAANAAGISAQASISKADSEAATIVGNYEALLPGIGNSVGGGDIYFFNRTLGQPDDTDISLQWRQVQAQSGNLAAWNSVIGTYGFNEKLAMQNYETARQATVDFNKGFNAASTIMGVFQAQMGKDWTALTYERITGGQEAVAAQYRLFLIGAFRKPTVGLGNPSNFEQELLLNLVPDPTATFQITSKSLAKAKMLTLMTVANHLAEMESAKFVPSDKTAKEYTKKLIEAGIIAPGQKVDVKFIKEFNSILRRNPGDPEGSIRAIRQWAQSTGNSNIVSMVTEATDGEFIRGGSTQARQVASNINRFLEQTAGLSGGQTTR